MLFCVAVCGEAGSWWVCIPEGRLQPGQKPGSSQTHPSYEGWRNQTHSNSIQFSHTQLDCTLFGWYERVVCRLFQAPNLESRELWKGFLYSVIDVNIHVLHTRIPLPIHFSPVLSSKYSPLCPNHSWMCHPVSPCCRASCRCWKKWWTKRGPGGGPALPPVLPRRLSLCH